MSDWRWEGGEGGREEEVSEEMRQEEERSKVYS
jgi:hypothetical protein